MVLKLKAVPESAIHKGIATLLAYKAPRHVIWWHTPNGERRDKVTGARLKAMGVKPGVPDFLLYDTRTGHLHCLEVKAEKGRLSDAQKDWKEMFDRSPTGRYAVVRSSAEAAEVLMDWWG